MAIDLGTTRAQRPLGEVSVEIYIRIVCVGLGPLRMVSRFLNRDDRPLVLGLLLATVQLLVRLIAGDHYYSTQMVSLNLFI